MSLYTLIRYSSRSLIIIKNIYLISTRKDHVCPDHIKYYNIKVQFHSNEVFQKEMNQQKRKMSHRYSQRYQISLTAKNPLNWG